MKRIRKAVLPVAGLGTRFLPATKATPKEMLTVVDRPVVQHVVDEAKAAGIEHFVFVTGRGKSAIEDHFDIAYELEATLEARGKKPALEGLKADLPKAGATSFTRQQAPLGLGHAVWCAREIVGDEPFAVILPDDVIAADTPCLQQMVEAHAETGGSLVAAMEVPPERTQAYGVLDTGGAGGGAALVAVRGMVEKPAPAEAPSNLAVIGRYVLAPSVMDTLGRQRAGAGGEIQLTDAIAAEVAAGRPVHGLRFRGQRFDCGSKAGFLQATVAFGLARDDLREEFAAYLADLAPHRLAAE